MKIESRFKPELCVCTDSSRENIAHVHLDVKKKCAVATNGYMLVVTPVEPQEGDVTGPLSTEPIKAARKLAGKGGEVAFRANSEIKLLNGATFPRPQGLVFPPIDQIIPSYKKGTAGTLTIGINAKALFALAQALGANKTPEVYLTIQLPTKPGESVLDPYVVTVGSEDPNTTFGILMPCLT